MSSPREYLMPHLCRPHSPHSKVYYRGPEQTVCGSTFKGEGRQQTLFISAVDRDNAIDLERGKRLKKNVSLMCFLLLLRREFNATFCHN